MSNKISNHKHTHQPSVKTNKILRRQKMSKNKTSEIFWFIHDSYIYQ